MAKDDRVFDTGETVSHLVWREREPSKELLRIELYGPHGAPLRFFLREPYDARWGSGRRNPQAVLHKSTQLKIC
jgi:hypothetical protein